MADATGQGDILKAVVPWDTAIVWPADSAAAAKLAARYGNERDLDLLAFKEGARRRLFHTRRLRRSENRDVRCLSAAPHQQEVAFAHGVTQVDEPDGAIRRPQNGTRWTPEELDEHFDDTTVAEIGAMVVENSRLPLGLKPTFALLPSSADALGALLFLSAAPSQDAASPNKSAPAEASGT